MKHFRGKIVIIFLDSELDKLKVCLIYNQYDDEETLPSSHLELLEDPPDRDKDNHPAPIPIMPMNQCELLVGLRNYIMSTYDAGV